MGNVFHYNSRKTSPKTTKKVKKVEKNFFACLFYKYIVLLRKIGKCFPMGRWAQFLGRCNKMAIGCVILTETEYN